MVGSHINTICVLNVCRHICIYGSSRTTSLILFLSTASQGQVRKRSEESQLYYIVQFVRAGLQAWETQFPASVCN